MKMFVVVILIKELDEMLKNHPILGSLRLVRRDEN